MTGRLIVPAAAVWAALLGLVLARPAMTASPSAGEDLTRNTVRLSLLFYAAALTLMIRLGPGEWPRPASGWRGGAAQASAKGVRKGWRAQQRHGAALTAGRSVPQNHFLVPSRKIARR